MGRIEYGLMAVVALVMLVDLFARVLPDGPGERTANAYDYIAPGAVVADKPPVGELPSGLDVFGVSPASLAAAQAKQQEAVPTGAVEALYKDGRRLRLEGLFTRGNERFAVVVNDNGRGGSLTRQTVRFGETLFDFTVVAFGHLSLMLQHPKQDEPLELVMFKPKAK